jgi:Heparinase II/III-like protein/Heparinase II/III N-terminus
MNRDEELLGAIRALGRPRPLFVGAGQPPMPAAQARRRGYVIGGSSIVLTPPIDWRQDPRGSRTWCFQLHSLFWIAPLLLAHAQEGDEEALAMARDVVLDWVRRHLRAGDEEVSEFAWYDMAVGVRAPHCAYVLRICLVEEMLEEQDAELLLEAVRRHGRELEDNYTAGHNHGLFQDEGLYLVAQHLPCLRQATGWSELALARMQATLEQTFSFREGAHLEHSSGYQLGMIRTVSRLAANISEVPALKDLLDRLRRTAAWQVTPRGRMAQLGDTDDLRAPEWAQAAAARLRGLNALHEAGQAFVRDGESYLAVSAAHHSGAHKHSDDSGLILVENGVTVLGDAGRWGYYEDEPDRAYARSAQAHNVLVVDGEDFGWRDAQPYGSGLVSAGREGGEYTIVVRNPLLLAQGVEHRRVIRYRPGEALTVVDEVDAPEDHEYSRHFHFGPRLEAKEDATGGVALSGAGIASTLADSSEAPVKLELVRGRDEPTRLGWAYTGDRKRTAVWTAVLRSRARSATLVATVALNGKTASLATSPVR